MTRKAALCLLGLAACDRVFGLERQIDAAPDDPAPEAAIVSGRLALRTSTFDAMGAQGDQELVYDPVMSPVNNPPVFHVVLPDGGSPEVTYRADGTFEFAVAQRGEPYRLQVTTPNSDAEYQLSTPTLDLLERTAGRVDRKAPIADSRLVVNSGLGTAAFAYVTTFGAPTSTRVGATPATLVFGPNLTVSPFGKLGLPDGAKGDRTYVTTYAGVPTTTPGYYTMVGLAQAMITVPDGGSVTFSGTINALATSSCARIHTDRMTEFARLQTLVTGTFAAMSTDWFLYAVPARDDLYGVGPTVIASNGAANVNDVVSVQHVNPFAGTQLVLTSGVGFGRDLIAPGATTPARIIVGDRVLVQAESTQGGCTGAEAFASFDVPFPTAPLLAGMTIAGDGTSIALAGGDPTVSWSYAGGDPQVASLQLVEVAAAGTKTQLRTLTTIRTLAPSAVIDRALFVSGHTYVLRVDASMGTPDAATGDFRDLMWPQQNATNWSHTFVMQ